ncbi:MAG TPA: YbaN family protein [Rhizorhapis sp.]
MLGFIWVGIGAVGAFVPLLPTTIFIILALGCFARSSPRLEHWLLNHERFGPALRAWRDQRAISRSAKRAACIGMTVGYGLFCVSVRPSPLLAFAVAAGLAACAAYVLSRPQPRNGI